MRKISWKMLILPPLILAVLVVCREVVTVGRQAYYGREYGMSLVWQDPWLYVSISLIALFAAAMVLKLLLGLRKPRVAAAPEEPEALQETEE